MAAKLYRHVPSGVDGVDVWVFDLALPSGGEAHWLADLAPAERDRAALLNRPELRRRFLATRGTLRRILAEYRREAPSALVLVDGALGKPALAGGPWFNVSHAEDLAVCAVSAGRRVGIDVERVRPIPSAERIVGRWFSTADGRWWRSLGPRARVEGFLRLWTRQEAYLKALGVGLAGLEHRLLLDRARWEVLDLSPGPGYVGALVAERCDALTF